MCIDLTREPGIPLSAVARLPWLGGRGGKRLHVATVHRWCTHGIRGVRLEFVQRGGTRVTTEAALQRFFARLRTASAEATGPNDQAASRRDRVDEELEALGL
jgi:hypothetical protein